ncbi:hypothetical protein KSD_17170 [Ktedonobacter sp. SOSP1-85]|uniref:hypothetical protein n=1 Tax=Ktedonobacter sp. SOSP1-85 TaxID=2778367 RepID=UPI001916AD92|nr:hypothetical protein [Ktedonobacter sp. SOSP1-85]GHO73946.1 hypothetical protein KSD_17170 [Ktedonobacter sp. SOSP1-85]
MQKEQKPEDLIRSIAKDHHISLKSENINCLCYVYALVFKEVARRLAGDEFEDDEEDNDENEYELSNEASIRQMKIAIEKIYKKFCYFIASKKIKESDPRYHDIKDVLPSLIDVASTLESLLDVYKNSNLAPEDPQKLSIRNEAKLLKKRREMECYDSAIIIDERIKWWRDQPPMAICQDLASTG